MNKVLIICSGFLPLRSGGTIRCEKQAKYLPQFGWETIVFTKKFSRGGKLDFDYTLDHCKVYSTNAYDIVKFLSFLKEMFFGFIRMFKFWKIESNSAFSNTDRLQVGRHRRPSEYIFVPDSDILWAIFSLFKALWICKKEKPSIIFSSSPNNSVHLVALFLKKFTKLKWVMEFRDPWTMNPFSLPYPLKIMNKLNNYLERKTIMDSDVIVVTSEQYKKDFLKKYKFLDESKIHFNPNGYDPEDFENLPLKLNDKYVITHVGKFYESRKSTHFVLAIDELLRELPEFAEKIHIRFIGGIDAEGFGLIETSKYKDIFYVKDYVPHKESLVEMCSADLLLLVPGPGNGTMPGKAYEYLAAQRPILCLADEGPTIQFVTNNTLGKVSKINDISDIKNNLLNFIKEGKHQENKEIHADLKNMYSRKTIANKSAAIFNSLV